MIDQSYSHCEALYGEERINQIKLIEIIGDEIIWYYSVYWCSLSSRILINMATTMKFVSSKCSPSAKIASQSINRSSIWNSRPKSNRSHRLKSQNHFIDLRHQHQFNLAIHAMAFIRFQLTCQTEAMEYPIAINDCVIGYRI